MVEGSVRRSALAHRPDPVAAYGGALHIAARADRAYLHVRVHPDDAEALSAAARALGAALPREPNTMAPCAGGSAAWLGPGEWLIDTAASQANGMGDAFGEASARHWIVVTDLSHGRCGFEIGGARAIDLLRKGCTLDLHPRAFRPGQCARTLLAKANVLLWPVNAGATASFALIVDRSYADYLWCWLADAALEYAPEAPAPSP
jgi:sarcosine oxidase subunit gamma